MSTEAEPEGSLKSADASPSCRPGDVVGEGNTGDGVISTSCSPAPQTTKSICRSSKWDDSGASPLVCYALRLRPGEELKSSLADFASSRGIQAGFIVSCVGSVRDVTLRLAGAERPSTEVTAAPAKASSVPEGGGTKIPRSSRQKRPDHGENREQEHHQQPMLQTGPDARFEVLSLVGTLSPSGLHLHASLGDEEGAVCGGHLIRAIVHTTAEIVIGDAPALAFSRDLDPRTGFKELVISGRKSAGGRGPTEVV